MFTELEGYYYKSTVLGPNYCPALNSIKANSVFSLSVASIVLQLAQSLEAICSKVTILHKAGAH